MSVSSQTDEDWTQITDPGIRKRVQNRLSQRKHREKVRQNQHKLISLTSSMPETAPSSIAHSSRQSNSEPLLLSQLPTFSQPIQTRPSTTLESERWASTTLLSLDELLAPHTPSLHDQHDLGLEYDAFGEGDVLKEIDWSLRQPERPAPEMGRPPEWCDALTRSQDLVSSISTPSTSGFSSAPSETHDSLAGSRAAGIGAEWQVISTSELDALRQLAQGASTSSGASTRSQDAPCYFSGEHSRRTASTPIRDAYPSPGEASTKQRPVVGQTEYQVFPQRPPQCGCHCHTQLPAEPVSRSTPSSEGPIPSRMMCIGQEEPPFHHAIKQQQATSPSERAQTCNRPSSTEHPWPIYPHLPPGYSLVLMKSPDASYSPAGVHPPRPHHSPHPRNSACSCHS